MAPDDVASPLTRGRSIRWSEKDGTVRAKPGRTAANGTRGTLLSFPVPELVHRAGCKGSSRGMRRQGTRDAAESPRHQGRILTQSPQMTTIPWCQAAPSLPSRKPRTPRQPKTRLGSASLRRNDRQNSNPSARRRLGSTCSPNAAPCPAWRLHVRSFHWGDLMSRIEPGNAPLRSWKSTRLLPKPRHLATRLQARSTLTFPTLSFRKLQPGSNATITPATRI